jgi:hypothetical protein
MAIAYFGSPISPNQLETSEGYLICKNVPIARTGKQDYLAREMGVADADPERVIPVMRNPEDVFSVETLASFEGKPVTLTHPPEDVTPENWAAYAKGHVQHVRRSGDYIMADLVITDPTLINQVRSGSMRQVSCGYRCDYTADGTGYKQTRIRGNHVAVVPLGRAGAAVSIQDAAPEAEKERDRMSTFRESVLCLLGMAAKDATEEEIKNMAATANKALDAEPAMKAPEAEPAKDVMVERAPKGDDLGSKLDKVIEMLGELAKKNDREEKMERKMSDEGDLEELIEKMGGAEGKEDALTVSEEDAMCGSPEARDAALAILRNVRPAVAAIQDKKERARVVDALLKSVKDNTMSGVLGAVQASARKKANDSASSQQKFEQGCRDLESAYASRNPHMKKEEK